MRAYISIFLFFLVQLLHAQYYIVYQLKGNVKHHNKKLIVGQQFSENDSFVISDKSSVTLLCPDYIPVTISQKGICSLKNTLCKTADFSVSAKYWKSVYTQLLHPHEPISDKNRKEYMQNVGGVTRGEEDPVIFPPNMRKIYVYKEAVTLKWQLPEQIIKALLEKNMTPPSVRLILYKDSYGSSVLTDTLIKGNSCEASIFKSKSEEDKIYYWGIMINGKKYGALNQIQFLSSNEYKKLWKKISDEISMIPDAAERDFAAGVILQDNFLYGEAFTRFNKASLARPKNIEYMKAANGLK